jgi:hypothetical protein
MLYCTPWYLSGKYNNLHLQTLYIIASIYLFFVGTIAGYQSSRYWPKDLPVIFKLKGKAFSLLFFTAAIIVAVISQGLGAGICYALLMYMVITSCIVFFANCSKTIRFWANLSFHVLLLMILVLNF